MSIDTNQLAAQQAMNNVINNTKTEPVEILGHNPFMLAHDLMRTIDLEQYAEKPYRARANRTFNSETGLSQYIADFKGDKTRVFADLRGKKIEAVFDYHQPNGDAGFGEHKANLQLELDPDYRLLEQRDGQPSSQKPFVDFMTDFADYITGYTQKIGGDEQEMGKADFLELISDLQGVFNQTSAGSVAGGGVSATNAYMSKVQSAKGDLPATVTLNIPVFLGDEPAEQKFRFITRNEPGEPVRIGFQLIRPAKVVEKAFNAIAARVEKNGGVKVYGQ